MRLLNVHNLRFTEFGDNDKPSYAVASHRWVGNFEATYKDFLDGQNIDSLGYVKVKNFAKYIRENVLSVQWLWIDTCCINKESAAELSEAINLMFEWYRDADICIAYLADVEAADSETELEQSEWFQRGWTLQELLAPRCVIFLTATWEIIGNKGAAFHRYSGSATGPGLERHVAKITCIPEEILHDYRKSRRLTVDDKLRWMEGRRTSREEDMSYSLYGIFGVSPGTNYGERGEGARNRLLTAVHAQDMQAIQRADEFKKIAAWLSPPDPWTNHGSARKLHEPLTCVWFLRRDEYHAWKYAPHSHHLWVHGKPGCGKTILCSTALDDIRTHCDNAANAGYAFFYFSFSDKGKQSYEKLVRSLVMQLGWREPGLSMLRQAYRKHSSPGIDDLKRILFLSARAYDDLYVLLDALDECPEEEDARGTMLAYLAELSQGAPNLRILATSRELPDIRASMERFKATPVPVTPKYVDADIRTFVSKQLSQHRRLSRLDHTTKTTIENTLSAYADGMFRWAYCQLQQLKDFKSTKPSAVRAALSALPATLDETYERMLINLSERDGSDAITLLQWLAYSQRPLTLAELAEATIINPLGEGTVDFDDRGSWEDPTEILAGFIAVEETDPDTEDLHTSDLKMETAYPDVSQMAEIHPSATHSRNQTDKHKRFRLAHFSIKEYLQSNRILEGRAARFHIDDATSHRFLAQSCLTYMMQYSESSKGGYAPNNLDAFPLLLYASKSWHYHARLQKCDDVSREIKLLTSEALQVWLNVIDDDDIASCQNPLLSEVDWQERMNLGLYHACTLGLDVVTRALIAAGSDINASAPSYLSLLMIATYRGYGEVVQALIDAGADISASNGSYNALQAASSFGSDTIVQKLIDAGADVNAKGKLSRSSSLVLASSLGYGKIVQKLINAGADADAGRALQAASRQGYEDIVRMLLDTGADFDTEGFSLDSALQVTSGQGHLGVVHMLIDAGADVNARAQGGKFTALTAAAARGHEKVVQVLLHAGAEVNGYSGADVAGGGHGSALQFSLMHVRKRVVQLLIDAGADLIAPGVDQVLRRVSSWGHNDIVQMVLDKRQSQ